MAQLVAYSTTIRSNRMTQVLNAIDGGSTAGILRVYDGTRPATGGTATNLLWSLPLGTTSGTKPSGSVTNGVLSINTNGTTGAAASGSGTATWGRFVDSAGTFCIDVNVGTSGADINLNSVLISSGQTVYVTNAGTITDGSS
jgi:hypothetical protein